MPDIVYKIGIVTIITALYGYIIYILSQVFVSGSCPAIMVTIGCGCLFLGGALLGLLACEIFRN